MNFSKGFVRIRRSRKKKTYHELQDEKKLRYSKKESDYIFELEKEGRVHSCIRYINKYLLKYPDDYSVCLLYSNCLRKVGLLDDSRKYLEKVMNDYEFIIYNSAGIYSNLISLLICEEKYEEALIILNENEEVLRESMFFVELVRSFLLGKLNRELLDRDEKDVYILTQVRDYSRERTLDHIEKHFLGDMDDPDFYKNASFNPSLDKEGFLKLVEESLEYNFSYNHSVIFDAYYFHYPNCGYSGDNKGESKRTDMFKVIVVKGTNHIITMYPIIDVDSFIPSVFIDKTESKGPVKILSRIDKFNNKYYN